MTRAHRPTDAELAILQVLWDRGQSTVREVHDAMGQDTGYTTTLKLLQIMDRKGLVDRDASRRSHVYRAVADEPSTTGGLVRDLMDKAFAGSAARLVMRALSSNEASREELQSIKALLDDLTDIEEAP